MKNTNHKASVTVRWKVWLSVMLPLLLGISGEVFALAYAQQVTYEHTGPTFGAHRETVEDMKVKVLGGYVLVTRSWEDGRWTINRRWAPLAEEFCSAGGPAEGPCTLTRAGTRYPWATGSTYVHSANPREAITRIETGYRWEDRDGNWIDYDTDLRAVAYGDRTNVRVTLRYDATGRISGVFDHHDTQVLWYEYSGDDVSAVRDYSGRRVEYQGSAGKITRVLDVRGQAWTYTYEGEKLKTKTDPAGRIITINYAPNGTVVSILDQEGVGTHYRAEYDKNKREFYKQERTASGVVTETWYDNQGELIRQTIAGETVQSTTKDGTTRNVVNRTGAVTQRQYDQWNNITKITHPDGATVTRTYDPILSNLLTETDERGTTTRYDYYPEAHVNYGLLQRKTEAVGTPDQRVTEYAYDAFGQLTLQKRLGDSRTTEAETVYTYDDFGNAATKRDPEGHTLTVLEVDALGNWERYRDPRGKVWQKTYDAAGNVLTETDPTNLTARYTYDAIGRLETVTDPGNNRLTYRYTLQGRVREIEDASTKSERYFYTSDGKVERHVDRGGVATEIEYDVQGRPILFRDGVGNEITLEYYAAAPANEGGAGLVARILFPTFTRELHYDRRDRVISQTDILDDNERETTRYAYDAAGNLITKTDPANRTTAYAFDNLGRTQVITDALPAETRFVYDNRDNLREVIDGNGNPAFRYEYDRNDRVIAELRALGQRTNYTYDPVGNVQTRIDAKNQKIRTVYDDAGRVDRIEYFNAANDATPARTVDLTEDFRGNISAWSEGGLSGSREHDYAGRLHSETINYGPFSKTYSYTRDDAGRKTGFTQDGTTTTYAYDAAGKLLRIDIPGIGAVAVNAYQWTAPSRVTLPGGTVQQTSYDALLRPQAIRTEDPAQNALLNYVYEYDAVGNIESKTTEHGVYDYGYDSLDRLISVTAPPGDESFTYDAVGNRLSEAGIAGAWNYNENYELQGYGDIGYEYDLNGNTVRKTQGGTQQLRLVYDQSDRLIEARDDGDAVIGRYVYDPFGRRLWKEADGTRIYFLYAEEGLVGEYDQSGALIRGYGYQPDSPWTADPVFLRTATDTYFYQNDHLGTPQRIADRAGAIVWAATYKGFGDVQTATNQIENPLRFPGQYEDRETGLHYNWHRSYNRELGRYINGDPIGYNGGINIYSYVNGNPLSNVDVSGLAGSPGFGDQFNPGGYRGDGKRDYTDYFNNRFPNTIDGSKKLMKERIEAKICANAASRPTFLPGLSGGADDIDINADMKRFGDEPQTWYERNVKIGHFQIKTDGINIVWNDYDCDSCYVYNTIMYVDENTGDNRLSWIFKERSVRMAEWPLSGGGCCD